MNQRVVVFLDERELFKFFGRVNMYIVIYLRDGQRMMKDGKLLVKQKLIQQDRIRGFFLFVGEVSKKSDFSIVDFGKVYKTEVLDIFEDEVRSKFEN